MKFKKLGTAALATAMTLSCLSSAFAMDTTDYTFGEGDVIDFCVYNVWGKKDLITVYPTIYQVKLNVTVSDYEGDAITTKLYLRESETWATHVSEPVVIDGNGSYTFYIDVESDDYEVTSDNLCTIYIKDYLCAGSDEDPEGQSKEASGVKLHMVMDSIEYNVPLEAPTEAPTEAATEAPTEAKTEAATEAKTEAATEAATQAASQNTDKKENTSSNILGIIVAVVGVAVIGLFIGVLLYKKNK